MPDKFAPEVRSRIMGSIRSTTKLEEIVCKSLWHRGLRFRRNVRGLFGTPDIAIKKYKVVIFLDSCFWHYCPKHGNLPKSNVDYWQRKLYRNVKRDYVVNSYYYENGWNLMRIWDHQVKEDFDHVIDSIIEFVENAKKK
ncbi:very short patch repair endonuclease [Paenibacillus sp. BSR1-1]|uniref:very short patch repair endonuclease n=1 Tax=Paenibacillus sp. BSR1-1 TaxID=3020845 RepID=UPI0025AFE652|nr:very short patch repair endonuclease [Paenibacillus sp. BSR1-1]MDN3017169.1 very short patch repair endonuclease [Paenibacillus sp. BSR1-1]